MSLGRVLFAAVALVAGLGLASELWHAHTCDPLTDEVQERLSLSHEHNVPTWLASSLLLACAIAAGTIAREAKQWRRHWWGAAGIAGYASLDEVVQLHEHLGGHFAFGGIFYYDWVIWAAAIVALVAAVFWPFVLALPEQTRTRLIVAGAVYIGGAVVMELPLGWWTERAGADTLGYGLIDWVEETLELVGATLALLALLAHREAARPREIT